MGADVKSELKAHDCFGAILRAGGGVFTFISPETGKVYATMDKEGVHVQKGSGKSKERQTISLRTLEVLIKELKRG